VEVSKDLLKMAKTLVNNSLEQQVVVHCRTYFNGSTLLRIWPSTYLVPKANNCKRAKLLHAINIPTYPTWLSLEASQSPYFFTLIFEGLPKDCNIFDLNEEIPERGGFYCSDIIRNETDVYYIDFG
jgi:hypothetical protein